MSLIQNMGHAMKKRLRALALQVGSLFSGRSSDSGSSKSEVASPPSNPAGEKRIEQSRRELLGKLHPVAIELQENGIYSLWHITHKDNLRGIVQYGILNNVDADKYKSVDISNHSVQQWREKVEPVYGKKIHDYTPTYLDVKNPMLYAIRHRQSELCILEISLSVLSRGKFLFTDGNAASRDTKFYNSVEDLSLLPWDVLHARYWSGFEDGKRKKCAEVLLFSEISPEYIKTAHCYSDSCLEDVSGLGVDVAKTKELFFYEGVAS